MPLHQTSHYLSSTILNRDEARVRANWAKVLSPGADDWVQTWIGDKLTGDKLVDTSADKFPFWTSSGKLSSTLSPQQTASLTQHLVQKYSEWVNPPTGQIWTEDDRARRIEALLAEEPVMQPIGSGQQDFQKGRYKLLADDYRAHIRYVADQWHRVFGINRTWTLAIAVYSSSQYTPMNAIARGEYRGKVDHELGSRDDLWLLAKAGAGIRQLAFRDQSWVTGLPVVEDPSMDQQQREETSRIVGDRRVLRRDMEFPDAMINAMFLKSEWNLQPRPAQASGQFLFPTEQSGASAPMLASFKELGFFSTTTRPEGVAPFNETSNVVVYVELYDNNSPFPAVLIKSLSCYPQESEVLWAPGVKFLVTKIRDTRSTTLADSAAGWRAGSRQWSATQKLEVYVRPMIALDQTRYVTESDLLRWLTANMNGSKIVDTDKFPQWTADGDLSSAMNPDEQAALIKHLHDKYAQWTMPAGYGKIHRKLLVDAKISSLLTCSRQERDKIVGDDYLHHIKQVASMAQQQFGLSQDKTLAIAIYSSSEYSKMNMIGMGLPGSKSKRAENLHLWLNAKTSYGIAETGRQQRWVSTGPKPDLDEQTERQIAAGKVAVLRDMIARLKQQGHLPSNYTPHLRRDEWDYPDFLIDGDYNLHLADDGSPRQKGLLKGYTLACHSGDQNHRGYFHQPDFLWSTTMELEGVGPFNEGNIAWVIAVSDASDEAAMNISALSAYPTEAEILWRYRQRFRIVYLEDRRETATYAEGEKKTWQDWKGRRKVSASNKVWVFLKVMPFTMLLAAPPNQTQTNG